MGIWERQTGFECSYLSDFSPSLKHKKAYIHIIDVAVLAQQLCSIDPTIIRLRRQNRERRDLGSLTRW